MSSERIIETGTVLDAGAGEVVVSVNRSEACAKCGLCGRAEEGVVSMRFRAGANPPKRGDHVKLILPYRSVWKQAFFVFGLPLLLMLAGLAAASAAFTGADAGAVMATVITAAGALTGLAAGMIVSFLYEARFRRKVREQTVIEIVSPA